MTRTNKFLKITSINSFVNQDSILIDSYFYIYWLKNRKVLLLKINKLFITKIQNNIYKNWAILENIEDAILFKISFKLNILNSYITYFFL